MPPPAGCWCSGSSTTAPRAAAGARWNGRAPSGRGRPSSSSSTIHASWLNQAEIYVSIVQRKVLTPNDFTDLAAVEQRLLAFECHYEQIARPFDGPSPRSDLEHLITRRRARAHSRPCRLSNSKYVARTSEPRLSRSS